MRQRSQKSYRARGAVARQPTESADASGPSPAYRQHHAVDAPCIDRERFRTAWRLRTRLDALLDAGRITPGEWQAGDDLRALWTRAASLRVASPLALGGSSGSDPHTAALTRVAAMARLRAIAGRLGWPAVQTLVACVVDDVAWTALGARLGCGDETARDRVVALLRQLARTDRATGRQRSFAGARKRPERRRAAGPLDQ